ncbi:MAG: BLUF domain-containing protein [Polyangiaceae bacterium]
MDPATSGGSTEQVGLTPPCTRSYFPAVAAAPVPVFQLIYVSAASARFSATDLALLLRKARDNNRKLGVSGLLIHDAGSFFQVLEGRESVVDALFARIGSDARHGRVRVLRREQVPNASFEAWSMGFVEGERLGLDRVPGFSEFLRKGSFEGAGVASQAHALAMAFRDGRFRAFVDGQ